MILVRFLDLKFLHKRAAIMIGTSNPPHVIWNASSLHYKSARERRRRALMANAGMRGRPVVRSVLSAQERSYLERQVRRHRVARSLSERCRVILRCAVEADIRAFIDRHNQNPRPFKWTKSADQILASVKRFCHKAQQTLCSEL